MNTGIQKEKQAVSTIKNQMVTHWVRLSGFVLLFGLGVCMILMEDGLEHLRREKATVWVVKEIWSWQVGVLLQVICLYYIYRIYGKIQWFKGWIVLNDINGFFLFHKGELVPSWENYSEGDTLYFKVPQNEMVLAVETMGDWKFARATPVSNASHTG